MLYSRIAGCSGISLGVALAVTCFAPQARAQDEKSVTVTGKAVGLDLSAQEEARQDALRQAVQQACGAFINAQTQVENYQATYDHVMSLATGFLNGYEVAREWQDADMSYCTVHARVSTQAFEKEWAAFAHTYRRVGYPRVVVIIVEDDDVDDSRPAEARGPCQSAIENFFLSKGVKLMDREQSDAVRERDLALAAINDDVNRLASVAAAFDAEVVVYGQAMSKYAGSVPIASGQEAHRWDISLTVRSYQTDTAAMLSSNTYRPEKRYTTTSRGSGGTALVELAHEQAPHILRELAERWNSQVSDYRTFNVSFEPCSRKRFDQIKTALGEIRGVQNGASGIHLRGLVNEVATVDVDWQFDLDMLADRIMKLEVEGLAFDIVEQTGNRLKIRVESAG